MLLVQSFKLLARLPFERLPGATGTTSSVFTEQTTQNNFNAFSVFVRQ